MTVDRGADQPVLCPRNRVPKRADDHLACPYCFGDRAHVSSGNPREFCDFDPAADPLIFGFPEAASRFRRG